MENLNQILWGEGIAFIDGVKLFEIQELAINFGMDVLEAKKGDGGGNIVVPVGQPVTGRAGFLGINASIMGLLTGGSSATGTKKRIRSEELAVSTNTVTCSQTPIVHTLEVIEKGEKKQPLKRVSESPEADEYTISDTTITFKTGTFEDATIIEVSYIYEDDASGETLSLNPNDLPSSFELYGSLRTKELHTDVLGDIIIYAAKCTRGAGEFAFGAAKGAISTPGFDFSVRIDSDGDFEVYWP